MPVAASVKSTSSVGLFFRKQALALARRVAARGGVARRIYDLFVLNATGQLRLQIGRTTIVEVPPALLGGFGGQNGAGDYYAQAVAVSFGPFIDALVRRTARLDPGTSDMIPFKADDAYVSGVPMGDGHLRVGALPAWAAYRNALNDSTGVYSVCPSAMTIAVCPDLEVPLAHPYARSLFICRTTGAMAPGVPTDGSGTPVAGASELPLTGHPAVSAATPEGTATRVSGLEIAADQFVLSEDDELRAAGATIEWGLSRGVTAVAATRYVGAASVGDRLYFVRHAVVEGASPRYTASVLGATALDADSLPSGDQPDALSAVTAVDLDGYTFPVWVDDYLLPDGRSAADGHMRFARDVNQFLRLWAGHVGDATYATSDSTLALVEVQVSHDSTVTVDAQGYRADAGEPGGYAYTTKTFRAAAGTRTLSYAASLSSAGVLALRKLDEFVDDRFDTAGSLTRHQWQAFLGVTDRDAVPYLVATRRAVPYEVRAADPDVPGPPEVQGEPERRVVTDTVAYVKPSELTLWLVSAGANVPVDLGAYFPALGNHAVSTVVDGGREYFGDEALHVDTPRVGGSFPLPFCQYAPGVLLVIGHANAQFASSLWTMTLFLVDVATGEVVQTIPTALHTTYNARLTVTCVEQAAVGVDGAIVAHGRVLLSVSSLSAAPDRADGLYMIQGMETLTWLAREPSNVAAVYGGNALVPATLGVTMNLMSVPRPAAP